MDELSDEVVNVKICAVTLHFFIKLILYTCVLNNQYFILIKFHNFNDIYTFNYIISILCMHII